MSSIARSALDTYSWLQSAAKLQHAPKMSNRKLRSELEELRKRIAELESKGRFPYPVIYLPQPATPPPQMPWEDQVTCRGVPWSETVSACSGLRPQF